MKYFIPLFIASSICSLLYAKEYIVEDDAQKSTYVDGIRQGMTWWYNDAHKIKSKVNFENGKENGLYISYYDNGEKKLVVTYVNGQKHNIQKIYYDNGQLGSQVNYNMGRREGLMTEWDYKGFKSSEVLYKHNYKVGIKKYYDHEGKVTFTQEFKMDRNPVMIKMLKDKRKETLVDLAKYGLMPKEIPEQKRLK
jgi:antitoxin component YwqK of YwqJK toxin-antitoxin module